MYIFLAICAVISLIICFVVMAQLNTVQTENASAYATEQGLDLRVRTDRMTHVRRYVEDLNDKD